MIHARTVHGPGPTTWRIRRRWAHRPSWRGRTRRGDGKGRFDFIDLPLDFADDFVAGILIVIAIAVFVVFMIFIGWPLLLFLVESLLIFPVTFVVGVIARVLFRRPWTIEATTDDWRGERKRVTWNVVGWRASSEAATRMEAAIRATGGVSPDPPADLAKPRAHRRRAA